MFSDQMRVDILKRGKPGQAGMLTERLPRSEHVHVFEIETEDHQ